MVYISSQVYDNTEEQIEQIESLVRDTFATDFSNLTEKLNSINEDWDGIPFDVSLLTKEELSASQNYQINLSQVTDFLDFEFKIQNQISTSMGIETDIQEYERLCKDEQNWELLLSNEEDEEEAKTRFLISFLKIPRVGNETDSQKISRLLQAKVSGKDF